MNRIIASLAFIYALTACMGGPQMMQKSMDSNEKRNKVQATIIDQSAGVVVGQFEARSDATQEMSASDSSAVQGATITIPPNSIAINTSISIEEGASIALDSFVQNASGNASLGVAGTTNAVMVTSSVPMDLATPMTIQLALPSGASLAATDLDNLTVVYKVKKEATNQWMEGLIPRSQLIIGQKTISFVTSHFGTFQAVFLTAPVVATATEVVSSTPAISKNVENKLPDIVWTEVKAQFIATERAVKVTATTTGHQSILSCEVVGDSDQVAPFDLKQELKGLTTATFAIKTQNAATYSFRWTCEEQNGRRSQSTWSNNVEIPKVEKITPVTPTPTPPPPVTPTPTPPVTPVNQAPTISITQPATHQYVGASGSITIAYTADDADDDALVRLFYKGDPSGCDISLAGWIEIVSGLSEGTSIAYDWDLSAKATGTYYICAQISDGNVTTYSVSSAAIIKQAPPAISDGGFHTLLAGYDFSYEFSNTGTDAVICSSNPTNLNGLVLTTDNGTCRLSGSPQTPSSSTQYTITATSFAGLSSDASITLTVNNPIPPTLTNLSTHIFKVDSYDYFTFPNSGAAVVACKISPDLPAELNIAVFEDSCKVSGIPTNSNPNPFDYTVTAEAADGSSSTATVTIVIDPDPPVLTFGPEIKLTLGQPMSPITAGRTGRNATNCSDVNPPLPSGLTMITDGQSCTISGTPIASQLKKTHILRARARDGSYQDTPFELSVTTKGSINSTNSQRASFFDPETEMYWKAYQENNYIKIASSDNGDTWTLKGSIGITASSISVAHKDGKIFVVTSSTVGIQVWRMDLTPNQLTIEKDAKVFDGSGYSRPVTSVDSAGSIYIAATRTENSQLKPVFKVANNAATTLNFEFSDEKNLNVFGGIHTDGINLISDGAETIAVMKDRFQNIRSFRLNAGTSTSPEIPGSNTHWNPELSLNLGAQAKAFAYYKGKLYVGGSFTSISGTPNTGGLAAWDGSTWNSIGEISGSVETLKVHNDVLYVGGNFTSIDQNTNIKNIGIWDGTNWSNLDIGTNGPIMAIEGVDSNLYVGGSFTYAGSVSAGNIAKWNGSAWSSLGNGVSGIVNALASVNTTLYVGGTFSPESGVSNSDKFAKWDGSNWHSLGIVNGNVTSMAVKDTDLYIGGTFTYPANHIVKYITASNEVHPLGSGVSGPVHALYVHGNDIIAGGAFTTASGVSTGHLAKWNGSEWKSLGPQLTNNSVYSIICIGNELIAGGTFNNPENVSSNLASFNIGHISKATRFSVAPTNSGAIMAHMSGNSPTEHLSTSSYNGTIWEASTMLQSIQSTPTLQISSSLDRNTLVILWRNSSGGISYTRKSAGSWHSNVTIDTNTNFNNPRIPATLENSNEMLPVIWQENGSNTFIRSGTIPLQ